jgi:hypothetical protein
MTEKLLLTESPNGRISSTCDQRAQRSIGALYYHNFTHHHQDFICIEICEIMCTQNCK